MNGKTLKLWIPTLLAAANLLSLYLTVGIFRSSSMQWDFRVFYDAGNAVLHQMSPYNLDALKAAGLLTSSSTFVYPPLVAYLFIPFSLLPLGLAASIWFTFKLLLVVYSLHIFQKIFSIRFFSYVWFLPFLLFAYDSTIVWDLVAGNVSILQLALLSLAFWFFVKSKFYAFAVAITVLSFFKLQPVFLLGALLFLPWRKAYKPFLFGAGIFFSFIGLNFLLKPADSILFMREAFARVNVETGILSPSFLVFFQDLNRLLRSITTMEISWPTNFALGAYGFHCITVLVFILIAHRSFRKMDPGESSSESEKLIFLRRVFAFTLFSFFVLAPRVKNYDFVFLVPISFCLIMEMPSNMRPLIGFLLCLPYYGEPSPLFGALPLSAHLGPVKKVIQIAFDYWTLLCAFGLWCWNWSKATTK